MTTLLVAISGGHLAQLKLLAPRIARGDSVWLTDRTSQSESLLDDEAVIHVPTRAPRDWRGVLIDVRIALKAIRQYGITRIISTGSQIALSAYIAAKMTRTPFAYVESATRVTGLSATGKILDRCPGVRRYVQYPAAANNRWGHRLSVFDGFDVSYDPEERPIRNVVVTVGGNGEFGFPRMVNHVKAVLPEGAKVLWQLGGTQADGLVGRKVASLPSAELTEALEAADVVIGHAGTGTALGALLAGKTPLLVPRSVSHGEHVDAHQGDLAHFLATRGLAVVRSPEQIELSDLEKASQGIVKQKSQDAYVELFESATPQRTERS